MLLQNNAGSLKARRIELLHPLVSNRLVGSLPAEDSVEVVDLLVSVSTRAICLPLHTSIVSNEARHRVKSAMVSIDFSLNSTF